jgi:16S rRNA (cytosine1402-N4)-methyltransferase
MLAGLAVRPDGTYLDGTYGRGGHSRAVIARLGPEGRLLAIDSDPDAVASARKDLGGDPRVRIEQGNFAEMRAISAKAGFEGGFDGILLDLGVSSPQLDQPHRGFSFLSDGPLDMRMDPSRPVSAADWVNSASEREIGDVIRRYGEDRFARRIARAIVTSRGQGRIETTARLADVVSGAIPFRAREPGKHPATRTFQAIRIHVNDELGALQSGLGAALDLLKAGGRLGVISFHSLEDRMVKRFMRSNASEEEAWRGLPNVPEHARAKLVLIGRAIRAGTEEVRRNPRARSAVLRVAERVR